MTLARLSAESNRVQCARCGNSVDPLRADRVAIYGERFDSDPPARATVQAAGLPRNVRVEIDAIAIVGGGSR